MTNLSARDVEILKSESRFFHAGALAFALGFGDSYGCHYGMRSTRFEAAAEFKRGHAAAVSDSLRQLATAA